MSCRWPGQAEFIACSVRGSEYPRSLLVALEGRGDVTSTSSAWGT